MSRLNLSGKNRENSVANFYENYTLSYEERAKVYAPSAGEVAFVQLFGSSLVLNPHLHMIFMDGQVTDSDFILTQALRQKRCLMCFTPSMTAYPLCFAGVDMCESW